MVRLDTLWVMVEILPSAVETLVLIPFTEVVSEEMLPVWLVTVLLMLVTVCERELIFPALSSTSEGFLENH